MPPGSADDQVGANFQFSTGSFCAHAGHALLIERQIDHFVLHQQLETLEFFCVRGNEIEKIPLRHESDEFAARRQLCEVGDRHCLTIDDGAQFAYFLMWLLQELLEQSEFVHQLERGGVNSVAAKIAKE